MKSADHAVEVYLNRVEGDVPAKEACGDFFRVEAVIGGRRALCRLPADEVAVGRVSFTRTSHGLARVFG